MAAKKTDLNPPAEGAQAFTIRNAETFNAEFKKWKADVGEIEILGRHTITGNGGFATEMIYWRPKKKNVVATRRR